MSTPVNALIKLVALLLLLALSPITLAKYTKISNSGKALPDSAVLGTGANDWGCTYDSNTQLIWEVKTDDKGLRDQNWIYTWYSNSPDGNKGTPNGSDYTQCQTTGRCEDYTQHVNAQLYGASERC